MRDGSCQHFWSLSFWGWRKSSELKFLLVWVCHVSKSISQRKVLSVSGGKTHKLLWLWRREKITKTKSEDQLCFISIRLSYPALARCRARPGALPPVCVWCNDLKSGNAHTYTKHMWGQFQVVQVKAQSYHVIMFYTQLYTRNNGGSQERSFKVISPSHHWFRLLQLGLFIVSPEGLFIQPNQAAL